MRTILLAALALSSLPTHDADACGGYTPQPQPVLLSTHWTGDGDAHRAFVVLGKAPARRDGWKLLAPGTYGTTMIRESPTQSQPAYFTLVGPSGTRVVPTMSSVHLRRSWHGTPMLAMEVTTKGTFTIALSGRVEGASFRALEHRGSEVQRVEGIDVDIVTSYASEATKTALKEGGTVLTTLEGRPVGAFAHLGNVYLVLDQGGVAYTAYLGADR